jgi:hypothetical protein
MRSSIPAFFSSHDIHLPGRQPAAPEECSTMMSRYSFGLSGCARAMRVAAAIVSVASLGCAGGDHPPVYPVKGKVTFKGKPITEGSVIYQLEGGGDPKSSPAEPGSGPFRVSGRIQADGTFQLWAFPGIEGMPEGHYKVGISSRRGRTEGAIFDTGSKEKKRNNDVLRGRYSDPKTSGLKDEVAKGRPNQPSFDLQ